MKPKAIILLVALSGVAIAGPGRPEFAGPPEWVDTNENGQIDPEERLAFAELRREAARGLVDRADQDGDGEVSPGERQDAINAMRARIDTKLCELFEAAAGEGEGEEPPILDLEEFRSVGALSRLPEDVSALLFGLIDGDGDEAVTKEEFLAAIRGPILVPELPELPGRPDLPDLPGGPRTP